MDKYSFEVLNARERRGFYRRFWNILDKYKGQKVLEGYISDSGYPTYSVHEFRGGVVFVETDDQFNASVHLFGFSPNSKIYRALKTELDALKEQTERKAAES